MMRLRAAALSILLWVAVPLSPVQSVLLVDLRRDHVSRFAAEHPGEFVSPVQWGVAREIVRASYIAGVPPREALLVGWSESRLTPDVIGSVGELGPLQVNPRWTPEIVRQTTEQRIATGVRILAEAFRVCGDWARADHRYRTGRCR